MSVLNRIATVTHNSTHRRAFWMNWITCSIRHASCIQTRSAFNSIHEFHVESAFQEREKKWKQRNEKNKMSCDPVVAGWIIRNLHLNDPCLGSHKRTRYFNQISTAMNTYGLHTRAYMEIWNVKKVPFNCEHTSCFSKNRNVTYMLCASHNMCVCCQNRLLLPRVRWTHHVMQDGGGWIACLK